MACNSSASGNQRIVASLALTVALLLGAAPVRALPHGGGFAGHNNSGQGYLGVDIRTVTDPSIRDLHLRETHGVVVIMVDHDGPAWKAGLREHDVVQSVNGAAIETEDQLRRTLREMQPGRAVQIGISRDGSTQTLNATMANRDEIGRRAWEQHYVPPPPETAVDDQTTTSAPALSSKGVRSFGHSLMPGHILPVFPSYTGAVVDEIGPQLAEYFGLKGGKGLLVQSVDANSPAAAAGMHAGDVVLRVNGTAMASRSDWNRALHDSKGHVVSVVVMREHREQTLTVIPDSKRRSAVQPPDQPETAAQQPHWLAVMLLRR